MGLLSDFKIKSAKAKDKEYTLKDGDGLFLNVHPNGSKYWLFRFSWKGKQTRMSYGTYPEIDLKQARSLIEVARAKLARGLDPRLSKHDTVEPKKEIVETSAMFTKFALKWLEFKLKKLNAKPSNEKKNKGRGSTEVQIRRAFDNDIFPVLKDKYLRDVTRADLLLIQKEIEKRNALSVAEKVRFWLDEIFRYAVATGEADINPASDLDIAALPYRRNKHYPYIKAKNLPELYAKLSKYRGERQTILGLKLLLLTGVRSGELRFSEPWQFDLKNKLWQIPAKEVKQLQQVVNNSDALVPDYIVPLSRQAVAIVEELLSYHMHGQRYLLRSRSNPLEAISENTFNKALYRMGFQNRLSPHGMRQTISTELNEKRYDRDFVEAQLSHSDKDKVRATYNHAEYVEHRREMMQDWANMLDKWEQQALEKNDI